MIRVVDEMPEIDIGKYKIVNNGANVTISCNELDENANEYTWKFKGVDLQFTGFVAQEPYSRIHQYTAGEITILKIDTDYAGEYRCTTFQLDSTEMTDSTTLEVSDGCPSGCE
ncbi:immunoglobulin domain-containing protein, partial [Salmonella sp. s51228]|uniref:immunoglobulin domain-containing protein n=1 Tax=Salmonella sp. s51228 TaxID=3159652 RepID=UPI0039801491